MDEKSISQWFRIETSGPSDTERLAAVILERDRLRDAVREMRRLQCLRSRYGKDAVEPMDLAAAESRVDKMLDE